MCRSGDLNEDKLEGGDIAEWTDGELEATWVRPLNGSKRVNADKACGVSRCDGVVGGAWAMGGEVTWRSPRARLVGTFVLDLWWLVPGNIPPLWKKKFI